MPDQRRSFHLGFLSYSGYSASNLAAFFPLLSQWKCRFDCLSQKLRIIFSPPSFEKSVA
jgi:hypothetical protein